MTLLDEHIDVELSPGGVPVRLAWRGRHWVVLRVLGRWPAAEGVLLRLQVVSSGQLVVVELTGGASLQWRVRAFWR